MLITGRLLIDSAAVVGCEAALFASNPSDGSVLQPAFNGASAAQGDEVCELAGATFDAHRAWRWMICSHEWVKAALPHGSDKAKPYA